MIFLFSSLYIGGEAGRSGFFVFIELDVTFPDTLINILNDAIECDGLPRSGTSPPILIFSAEDGLAVCLKLIEEPPVDDPPFINILRIFIIHGEVGNIVAIQYFPL
jgi:hypothetical protein